MAAPGAGNYDLNTKVRSRNRPWRTIVRQSDPDYERENREQVEYEFSNGRKFKGITANRGAYGA